MQIEKFDRVLIDGKWRGEVVQDGHSRSRVSHSRSDGEPGWEENWYPNNRLTVVERRSEKARGDEAKLGIKLY